MKKIKSSLFTRIIALVAVAVLIVTSVNMPALADEDDFFPGVISPDINDGEPDPGFFIDPVLPPEPEPEPEPVDPCADGHDMVLQRVDRDSTCSEPGLSVYVCSRCGYAEERPEPAPDSSKHVVGLPDVTNQPTCTESGKTIYRCIYCGEIAREENEPSATGHTRNGGNITEQANCQHEGRVSYACSVCGADMGSETIPMTDHVSDGGSVVKQPTTQEPGEIEYRCVNCGKVLREEQIPVIPKRERPNASFNTQDCIILNMPDNCTVTLNGAVITNSAYGSYALRNNFPQTGDYTITITANEHQGQASSDPQSIHIHKPAPPSHLKSTAEPAKGGVGHIGGVDTNMEYTLADQESWSMCTSSSQPVPAGIYCVRYRATTGSIASDAIEVVVKKDKSKKTKEETPNATFDGANSKLIGVKGCKVSFDGGNNWTDKIGDNAYNVNEGAVNPDRGIMVYKPGNGSTTTDSDNEVIKITKQSQPYGLSATSATAKTLGAIYGVDSGMQYKLAEQKSWINITANPTTVLPGTYYVRRIGGGNALPSDAVTVIIKQEAVVVPTVIPTPVPTAAPTVAPTPIPVEHEEKKEEKKANADEPKEEEKKVATEESAEETVEVVKEETAGEIVVEKAETEEPTSTTGEKGWKDIEATFETTEEPVVIELHKDTAIPAEVFEKAVETSTSLEIAASAQAMWTIEPDSVNVSDVQELGKINLGIDENSTLIPDEALASVENVEESQKIDHTFDIRHDGNFGFKARLTLKVTSAEPGKYANLYWYNNRAQKMEYIDSAVVNENKEATFNLSHASSYAVVISNAMMSQESVKVADAEDKEIVNTTDNNTESTEIKSEKKKTNSTVVMLVIIIFVLLVVIGALVIIMQKKNDVKKRAEYIKNHSNKNL